MRFLLYNNLVFWYKLFMFAVIKTGGKQYIVSPGDKIKIEKLETSEGEEVSFEALLISDKETLLGTPYVNGYNIKAKVLRQGKGEKIIVYKYKPKKRYHKKQGHRQLYTEVEILSIEKGGTGEKKSEAKKASKSVAGGVAKASPRRATATTKKKVSSATKKATKQKASAKAD